MSKKQLSVFSLVLILIVGNGGGMATMLPVYLSQRGADSSQVGLFFSALYLGLAVAGILAGWLSERLQRRKWLCIASAAGEILNALVVLIPQTGRMADKSKIPRPAAAPQV